MRRPDKFLVPFLLSIGPLWILIFANVDSLILRVAGACGAIGLSVGLVLMLSMIHSLRRRIEFLEAELQNSAPSAPFE